MTYENYIKAKLADYAIVEGYRYGGTDCALAVAQVIANRVNAGWHGGDWRKVLIDAPNKVGTTYEVPFDYDTRELAFRQIVSQIDDIYHGTADDSNVNVETDSGPGTTVSLYYCVLHNVTSEWFKNNIIKDIKNHPRIAVVGQLTFFG
jgi:hypothetical protein